MTLTPIQEADKRQLLDVWNAAAVFDPLTIALVEEKLWGDANFDPSLTIAWRKADRIEGFGVAICRHQEDAITGYIKLLAVSPTAQRQRIGTQLYAYLERACIDCRATELRLAESAPNYLTPGVDKRYEAAVAFFERQDFVLFGETTNMKVDLRQWPDKAAQAGLEDGDHAIQYDRASNSRRDSIKQFINEHWPSWWPEVSVALANDPISLLLAMDGEQIVGFAAHDANNRGTGWFGPMGTAPSHRGRGIGQRLLHLALDDMRQAGYHSATIPWVGPVEFYERHAGAVVDRTFVRYKKSLG